MIKGLPGDGGAAAIRDALLEARLGSQAGHGGPFGAVVIKDGKVIGRGHNTVLRDSDPTRHAEMNALTAAGRRLKSPHLIGCVLIASSEPCPMCLAAAYWSGVAVVYYGLSRRVAAKFGFRDAFLYRELALPGSRRKLVTVKHPATPADSEAVFRDWKKRGGRLY